MAKIKVGFSVSTLYTFPVLSWIIRLFEKWFHSSHVYYELPGSENGEKMAMVLEASIYDGVNLKPATSFYPTIKVNREYGIEVTEDQIALVLDWWRKHDGTGYGKMQLVGDAIQKLLSPFGMKNNPFSDGPDTMVCTETVGRVLENVLGLDVPQDFDVVGLRDIQRVLESDKSGRVTRLI